MSTLETAIALAALAHEGQVDQAGWPYILHPLRVMSYFGPPLFPLGAESETHQIVAVLHDVVEDTAVTLAALAEGVDGRKGFSAEIVQAVDGVTRRKGEQYFDFIARARDTSALARNVKMADVLDNLARLRDLPDEGKRVSLRKRYLRALEMLGVLSPPEILEPGAVAHVVFVAVRLWPGAAAVA